MEWFGYLVFGTCGAIIVALAANDMRKRRAARRAWEGRVAQLGRGPRLTRTRYQYLSTSGRFYSLLESPLDEVQQLRRTKPYVGVPQLVAVGPRGAFVVWPEPGMAGQVVERLGAAAALKAARRR